jgi:NAD(P)-dependent dehydrogenase (short-subunit alcohol dehydrogenase family)
VYSTTCEQIRYGGQPARLGQIRRIFITGMSTGIGRAIAEGLAGPGDDYFARINSKSLHAHPISFGDVVGGPIPHLQRRRDGPQADAGGRRRSL